MSLEEKKKIKKRVNILLVISIVIAVGFISILALRNETSTLYRAGLILWVFFVILITSVLEPYWMKLFQDVDSERRNAYIIYLFLEVLSYAGLLYFAFFLGDQEKHGIYGVLVFALAGRFKRKYRDIFYQLESIEKINTEKIVDSKEDLEEEIDNKKE